jgi:hypothetical protein
VFVYLLFFLSVWLFSPSGVQVELKSKLSGVHDWICLFLTTKSSCYFSLVTLKHEHLCHSYIIILLQILVQNLIKIILIYMKQVMEGILT